MKNPFSHKLTMKQIVLLLICTVATMKYSNKNVNYDS